MKELHVVMNLLFKEKKDIILSIICGFVAGITAVGLFSASGYLISQAALAPPIYTLMVLVATVKLFGIISAISRYGERFYSHRGTFTMLSNIRVTFYEKLEPLVPGVSQKFRSGDLLSRIVGDVETLQNYFLRVFYPPIVLLLVFLCTILFTAYFSLETAVIIFIGFILTTILIPSLFAIRQRKMDRRVRESRGKLATDVTELFYGFRDLKIYQRLEEKENELENTAENYIEEQEREGILQLYNKSLNTFVSLCISIMVLGFGAYLITLGRLDGIFLAMLAMISLTVFENTTSMAIFPSHLEDNRQAAKRLHQVVGESPTTTNGDKELHLTAPPEINMRNVSFTFPGEEREILQGIDIQIPAGSKTAIVGPSGSGKSTILQLLLKIYEANDGEIKIDQENVANLKQESIWSHTNVVLQENHYFYGTIEENLKIAKDNLTPEVLISALEKVNLAHFNLEDEVLEKGENLSGGEKQRLAIARVLLKKSNIWFLDEPMSSLDALTEEKISEHLFKQAADDTVIFISHRLNGLDRMDQIIVMENGKIVESGTYDELMMKKEYFYELKQIEQSVF